MTAVPPPPRRRTRRLRLVVPPALVVLLIVVSAVAYSLQQADESDPAYLSPVSAAPIGAARLARLVEQRGVTVERATRTPDALVSAHLGGATLLVPAPALVHPSYLRMLKSLPASTRLVLVAPTDSALSQGRLPLSVADRRWATAVEVPGCGLAAAAGAGAAAARQESFTAPGADAAELHRCYHGGLVQLRWHGLDLTVIGANDVFRNDRIGEHGNAALATDLLTGTGRLIWLDVHRLEPPPPVDPGAPPDPAPSPVPGTPAPDVPTADPGPDSGSDSGGDSGRADGGGSSARNGGPSLWSAFPPAAWATAALLLVTGVLLAVARGRRLDAPVPEPLPVTVPAAETVLGWGRLYRRAKARGTALSTQAAAARQRLRHLLDLPADASRDALVTATAAQAGWSEAEVAFTLYPPTPADDKELVAATAVLDGLLRAVTRSDVLGRGELR